MMSTEPEPQLDLIVHELIYSYTVHEALEAMLDTIRNHLYYHPKSECWDYLIVINCSPETYAALCRADLPDLVHLNPETSNKRKFTYDVLHAHLQNLRYLYCQGHQAKYFIPLASNCYFQYPVTHQLVRAYLASAVPELPGEEHKSWWRWWPKIKEQEAINSRFCAHYGLTPAQYHVQQHEGQLLDYAVVLELAELAEREDFVHLEKADTECVFEEYLLATAQAARTGRSPRWPLCQVFWMYVGFEDTAPPLTELTTRTSASASAPLPPAPAIKPVPRKYQHQIRQWQRQLTGNYRGPARWDRR
jgi:hypothetical protein